MRENVNNMRNTTLRAKNKVCDNVSMNFREHFHSSAAHEEV